MDRYDLQRFVEAQKSHYLDALQEVGAGHKRSHWMWYIFPQIKGLGFSETSLFYAISGTLEAAAYLNHPVLGSRLKEISRALLQLKSSDPHEIFGSPDDAKLRSSMTLFTSLENSDPVFEQVLDKFFKGQKDQKTLRILQDLL
jgi:uncharacterized protein (DUF1810 family)